MAKSFTNITGNITSDRYFFRSRKIEKEISGSLLMAQVFIITMGNPLTIILQSRVLPIIGFLQFMKIKPVIFGLVLMEE
jgi:hypothetical protein